MKVLADFAKRAQFLRWSPVLIRLLLEELSAGDEFVDLVGPIRELPARRYPQAVAVALALRYSYRKDLLRNFIRRLRPKKRERKRVG